MKLHQPMESNDQGELRFQEEQLAPFLRKILTGAAIGSLTLPGIAQGQQADTAELVPAQATLLVQQKFPKTSPFSSIVFVTGKEGAIDVVVTLSGDSRKFILVAVDGVSTQELWNTVQTHDFGDPQKRIAEDLPELLVYARQTLGMPEKNLSTMLLTLRDVESQMETLREERPTAENRMQIWAARRLERERLEREIEVLNAALMRTDLASLERYLSESSAFFARDGQAERFSERGRQIQADLALLEQAGGTRTVREWTLTLHSLIRELGDGHSGVDGMTSEKILHPGFAPCLFVEAEGRVAAILESREGLFAPGFPFVESINGISIEYWQTAAQQYVIAGSHALTVSRTLRMLRHLGELGTVLGVDLSKPLVMELSNSAGERTRAEFTLTSEKPVYGIWPRTREGASTLYTDILEGQVAYLRVGSMEEDLASEIHAFMTSRSTRDSQGLLVDVRGNSGGTRDVLLALYPYLHGDAPPQVANIARVRSSQADRARMEESLAGRSLYHADAGHFTAEERAAIARFSESFVPEWSPAQEKFTPWYYLVLSNAGAEYQYLRPVVVLINHDCFSATDVFTSALAPLGNVTTMGAGTGGGSGRSKSFELPSGIGIRLSTMASFQSDGKTFDGNGILPEVPLETPVEVWLWGADPHLEAARNWILSQP